MTLDGYFPIIIITWPYHYGQEKANKEKNDKNLTQNLTQTSRKNNKGPTI